MVLPVRMPQDFGFGNGAAFHSYAAQLDGLASGLPNIWGAQAPRQPPTVAAPQLDDRVPPPPPPLLGRVSENSQGGSQQGSGSPHGGIVTSEGSCELVRCSGGSRIASYAASAAH